MQERCSLCLDKRRRVLAPAAAPPAHVIRVRQEGVGLPGDGPAPGPHDPAGYWSLTAKSCTARNSIEQSETESLFKIVLFPTVVTDLQCMTITESLAESHER